jgi:PAS domain
MIQTQKLKIAIQKGIEERVVIRNYRKDGTPFWNRIQIAPMRSPEGKVVLIVGVIYKVSYYCYSNFQCAFDVHPVFLSTTSLYI